MIGVRVGAAGRTGRTGRRCDRACSCEALAGRRRLRTVAGRGVDVARAAGVACPCRRGAWCCRALDCRPDATDGRASAVETGVSVGGVPRCAAEPAIATLVARGSMVGLDAGDGDAAGTDDGDGNGAAGTTRCRCGRCVRRADTIAGAGMTRRRRVTTPSETMAVSTSVAGCARRSVCCPLRATRWPSSSTTRA